MNVLGALPMELTGIAVGVLLIGISILLTFRHKYVDGYVYPWPITLSFLVAGLLFVPIVLEFTIVGVLRSRDVTVAAYLGFGALGLFGLYYLWFHYPDTHPCASERS